MKRPTCEEWQAAFGAAPEAFTRRVEATVRRMQSPQPLRRKARLALALTCALVLAAGTALALNRIGLLDTLADELRRFLLPQAAGLLRTDIAQSGGALQAAAFTVEEAACDGRQVYAVIRVHGAAHTLLIDAAASPSWGTDWWKDGDMLAGATFSKRAHETGRSLVQARVDGPVGLTDCQIAYDGEDILYTVSLPAPQTGEVRLEVETVDLYAQADRVQRGALVFAPPPAQAPAVYEAQTPVDLPLAGLTLARYTLEQTPIATYMTAEYTLVDDDRAMDYANGIWIRWLDDEGAPYPEGQTHCELEEIPGDATRLSVAYRAFAALPETVTLEFYNGLTKQRFDTVRLPLRRVR